MINTFIILFYWLYYKLYTNISNSIEIFILGYKYTK